MLFTVDTIAQVCQNNELCRTHADAMRVVRPGYHAITRLHTKQIHHSCHTHTHTHTHNTIHVPLTDTPQHPHTPDTPPSQHTHIHTHTYLPSLDSSWPSSHLASEQQFGGSYPQSLLQSGGNLVPRMFYRTKMDQGLTWEA